MVVGIYEAVSFPAEGEAEAGILAQHSKTAGLRLTSLFQYR